MGGPRSPQILGESVTTHYVTTDSRRWYNHVGYGRGSWRKQREGKQYQCIIIRWLDCGNNQLSWAWSSKTMWAKPLLYSSMDRGGSNSSKQLFDPLRSITWSLVTPSSDQPMTPRHVCVLRPLQVTCDRNRKLLRANRSYEQRHETALLRELSKETILLQINICRRQFSVDKFLRTDLCR